MTRKNNKEYTYLSLFSGCGGFDVGFEKANFRCIGAYDNNPFATHVFSQNLKGPCHLYDLTDLGFLKKIETIPDVVISGSPCQGFSTIGKRKLDDPRNGLLLTGGKVAIELGAKVFIAENVRGSLSGEHKIYWDELIKMLKESGYGTKQIIYNAQDLGLAQSRQRVILYAWKITGLTDFELEVPKVEHVTLDMILNKPYGEEVGDHNLDFIPKSSADFIIAQKIKQGQKLSNVRGGNRSIHTWDIPEVFGEVTDKERELLLCIMKLRRQVRRRDKGDADPVDIQVLKAHFDKPLDALLDSLIEKDFIFKKDQFIELKNTFNGKFKRLRLNDVSPTVDTRFGHYKNYLHPTEHRALSVREAARIQGFDDTFTFEGPIQRKYEMIGNAVPPPLARHIADIVREKILRKYDARSSRKQSIRVGI